MDKIQVDKSMPTLFKTHLFLGENWGGTLILSQFSNFSQDFVGFADFLKYLTNSGGKPKKREAGVTFVRLPLPF